MFNLLICFTQVAEIFGIKIFHYAGNMNFVNGHQLSSDLQDKVGVKPRLVLKFREKQAKRGGYSDPNEFENNYTLRCIVVDMSAVSKIDPGGVATLRDVVTEFSQIDVPVYLAACSPIVFDKIYKCDLLEKNQLTFMIFATVHDAVFYAQRELVTKTS